MDSKVNEYHRCSVEHDDPVLDREIELQEITRLVVVVGELFKYGRSGMLHLLHKLFEVVWREELVPPKWREGLIVNLFKKGDKEDPGNYRGITLLSVVGKVFCQ